MSHIDELIEKMSPNGVRFSSLGEVVEFRRGTSITRDQTKPGKIPVLAGGQKPAYFHNEHNRDGLNVVIAGSGAYAGFVSFWQGPIWVSDSFTVTPSTVELDSKYLYYFLLAQQAQIHSLKKGGGVPHVYGKDLAKFSIPLPPVDIQKAIARILDTFTELESELEAELEARKKQYEHYRSELLSPSRSGGKMRLVSDICLRISSGSTPLVGRATYYLDGNIPWLRTQEVRFNEIHSTQMCITEKALKETGASWIPANCVIIAISGATAGRSAVNKIPLTTNQHCCNLEIDSSLAHYKYVYHWMASNYEQIRAMGQGARADLNSSMIKSLQIPLPPLDEQNYIVEILDKYQEFTASLETGLPAEIAARRKQYEYYRDQLLTFEELAS